MTTQNKASNDRVEIDVLKQRQEVREGVEAHDKIKTIQTKEEQRLAEISRKYLGGVPYERDRVIGEIRAHMQQTVQNIIEAGKRLIATKEAEKHGEWDKLVEEQLGISRVTAWRLMATARKFAECFSVKQLQLGSGGVSKLYALLSVPDEELTEFDETGLFRGVTLEALDKMTLPQFKKLIAEKEDWKAKAKQLELQLTGKYDSTGRMKKKNEALTKEIGHLKDELALAKRGLPQEAEDALALLGRYREDCLAAYYMLANSDPAGHAPIVKADLLNTACFLSDLFEILNHELSNRLDTDQPYPANLLTDEKKSFGSRHKEYLDIEVGSSRKE